MRTLHFWRLHFAVLATSLILAGQCGCSHRRCCVELGRIPRPQLFARWLPGSDTVNAVTPLTNTAANHDSASDATAAIDPAANDASQDADLRGGDLRGGDSNITAPAVSSYPAGLLSNPSQSSPAAANATPDAKNSSAISGQSPRYDSTNSPNRNRVTSLANSTGNVDSSSESAPQLNYYEATASDSAQATSESSAVGTGKPSDDGSTSSPASIQSPLAQPTSGSKSSPAALEIPQQLPQAPATGGQQAGQAVIDFGNEKIRVEPYHHVAVSDPVHAPTIIKQVVPGSSAFGSSSSGNPIRSVSADPIMTTAETPTDIRFSQQIQPNQSLLVKNHTVRERKPSGLASSGLASAEQFQHHAASSQHLLAPRNATNENHSEAATTFGAPADTTALVHPELNNSTLRGPVMQDREVLIDDVTPPATGPELNVTSTVESAESDSENVGGRDLNSPQLTSPSITNDSNWRNRPTTESGIVIGNLPPQTKRNPTAQEGQILLRARADFPYASAASLQTAQLPPPPVRVAARPWSPQYQVPAYGAAGISIDPDATLFIAPHQPSTPARSAGWSFAPLPTAPAKSEGPMELRHLPSKENVPGNNSRNSGN